MRRLLRILLNAATVLSFVLCAATMAAWVRSYRVRDFVYWSRPNPQLLLAIGTYRGGSPIELYVYTQPHVRQVPEGCYVSQAVRTITSCAANPGGNRRRLLKTSERFGTSRTSGSPSPA